MKDHEGCVRGFYWSNKAYYAKSLPKELPEINFGMYAEEGGTSGEMSMVWRNIGNKDTPQLRCFCDAWSALSLFPDLIKKLGEHDSEDITDEQFVEILKKCGFKDLTPYKAPKNGEDQSISNKIKLQKELSALEKRCKEIKNQINS